MRLNEIDDYVQSLHGILIEAHVIAEVSDRELRDLKRRGRSDENAAIQFIMHACRTGYSDLLQEAIEMYYLHAGKQSMKIALDYLLHQLPRPKIETSDIEGRGSFRLPYHYLDNPKEFVRVLLEHTFLPKHSQEVMRVANLFPRPQVKSVYNWLVSDMILDAIKERTRSNILPKTIRNNFYRSHYNYDEKEIKLALIKGINQMKKEILKHIMQSLGFKKGQHPRERLYVIPTFGRQEYRRSDRPFLRSEYATS